MKNTLFLLLFCITSLFFWECCTYNIPVPCNCNTPTAPKVTNISTNQATITWQAFSGISHLYLKNIETQQDTILTFSSTGNSIVTYSYTFQNLQSATTYSVKFQRPCGKACPSVLTPFSTPQLFSTDALSGSACTQPILFNVYNVKNDTLLFSWQSAASITDFRLYVADSAGNIAYNQPFSIANTGLVNVKIQKTNLPQGDYTAWIETDCGNASSLPSNMAVFGMRNSTGGPIVIIDDDLSVYKNAGNSGNILTLADIKTTTSCINSRNVSFQNTTNPKQIILAYSVIGNTDNACAPLSITQSRLRSFRVNSVLSNQASPYYRLSIPRIGCLCSNITYKVSALANDNFQSFATANTFTQYCVSCH